MKQFNRQEVVLVGGGGHALTCADILLRHSDFRLGGYVDLNSNENLEKMGVKHLGTDKELVQLKSKFSNYHVAVGQIKSPAKRKQLFNTLESMNVNIPSIVAIGSAVSSFASLSDGVLVARNAMVNAQAIIGKNSIINTGAIIEHGAIIGDHCHIAPGAIILGDAVIGPGSFVGSGSVIREGIVVAADSFVPAVSRVTGNWKRIVD